MKFSIITPVFNAAQTLEKTILSVIGQTFDAELEYIIIDGGSTDGSLEIIDRYRDRISLVISEKDKGVYDAMNKGILNATGDVVGIINSDDWYNEGTLKTAERKFREHQDLEILYSPVDTYFNGKHLIKFLPGSLDNLSYKFTINHPSCFVKKTVYNRIGMFDLSYSIAADYDFILRAYNAGMEFAFVEDPLASYSLNGLSGKPLAKFEQIRQSWIIGSQYISNTDKALQAKRRFFYLKWLLKEMVVFPVKPFLNPHISRSIKKQVRGLVGGRLPSDKYGAW
ncbi:glycosyltransferase family 2 protein [Vacuolonema iberomarrocanum]|uniref:glycosyltransferase family 2 protein n=1 Tax=Vacuolonema iberomarrocanum TaxID=3454632 RepID=UPI001A03374B|nr:glycosyltransferase [filamentous cyanobacterium LEGE 07170]